MVYFSIYTRQAAISEVLNTEEVFGTAAPNSDGHPQSILVMPVFDQIATSMNGRDVDGDSGATESDKINATNLGQSAGGSSSSIVGFVVAVIPWSLFFQNVLADGHDGNLAVLRESCGQVFTYRIDGGTATFVGNVDGHDPGYKHNYWVQSTDFATSKGDRTAVSENSLNDHCEYELQIFPSADAEAVYTSNKPWIFTVGVVTVVLFTSLVFFLYDLLVSRQKKVIMASAVKTNAIVESLFPSTVRDKLFNAERKKEAGKKNNKGNHHKRDTFKNKLRFGTPDTTIGTGASHDDEDDALGIGNESNLFDAVSAPIADLFPE